LEAAQSDTVKGCDATGAEQPIQRWVQNNPCAIEDFLKWDPSNLHEGTSCPAENKFRLSNENS